LVFGEYSADPIQSILIPCLILVVPLYDITLSTLLRFRDGDVKSWRDAVHYCGKDHLAHLLHGVGLSKRQAVGFLYALGFTGGLTALAVHRIESRVVTLSIAVLFGAGLTWIGILLGRVRQDVIRAEQPSAGAAEFLPEIADRLPPVETVREREEVAG
jgi:hypothetical protein